jgi:2-hydroxychromene-2-carboxylate isomerase
MAEPEPVFFYDLSSPYAYLAALRVDDLLPVKPRWQPIVFGAMLRAQGRTPWSLTADEREPGQRTVEQRAAGRGLPAVRWPPGWPAESYSLLPLRAVWWAANAAGPELGKRLTLILYEIEFVEGRALDDVATVLEGGARCGLDAEELRAGMDDRQLKDSLRSATDAAIERGVPGIPTVALGEDLYWGDDRLEDAAAALAS